MDQAREAFIEAITKDMYRQRREQRSDDIVDFLKSHWQWFFNRRGEMVALANQMGTQFPATVDAFCDQLGIPENVWFKRAAAADLRQLFATFDASKAKQTFMTCVEKSQTGEVCLFLVAGKSSLCVTNMQTQFEPGHMICYYKSTGELPDIHIFKADELPIRMPNLFVKVGD